MSGELSTFQRARQGFDQLQALGRTVLEEPTIEDRVTLGIAVVRGLGRALVQDRIVVPFTIARMNHARAVSVATVQLAEVVPISEAQIFQPVLAEAA